MCLKSVVSFIKNSLYSYLPCKRQIFALKYLRFLVYRYVSALYHRKKIKIRRALFLILLSYLMIKMINQFNIRENSCVRERSLR